MPKIDLHNTNFLKQMLINNNDEQHKKSVLEPGFGFTIARWKHLDIPYNLKNKTVLYQTHCNRILSFPTEHEK